MAIGKPGALEVVGAVHSDDGRFSPRMLTWVTSSGIGTATDSVPVGATAFNPPRPRHPASDRPGRPGSELALHGRSRDQRVVQGQHADRRGVAVVAATGLHFLFGVGVPVVHIEQQRRWTRVGGNRDLDAGRRVALDQDITVGAFGLHTFAKHLRTLHHRGLGSNGGWRGGRQPAVRALSCASSHPRSQAADRNPRATVTAHRCEDSRAAVDGAAISGRRMSSRNSMRVRALSRKRRASRWSPQTSSASPRRASTCRGGCPRRRPPRPAGRPSRGWSRRSGSSSAPGSAAAARTRPRAGDLAEADDRRLGM